MLKKEAKPVMDRARGASESARTSGRTGRESFESVTPSSAQSGPLACSRGRPDFQLFEERLLHKLQELDAAAQSGASTADAEGR